MEEEEKVKESLMINPLAYPEEKFTEDGKSYYYTRGDGTPITNESWSLKDLSYPLNVPFGGKRQGNLSDWTFTNWLVNAAPGQLAPIGAAVKGIKTMRNQHRTSPHGFYKEGSIDVKKANEIVTSIIDGREPKGSLTDLTTGSLGLMHPNYRPPNIMYSTGVEPTINWNNYGYTPGTVPTQVRNITIPELKTQVATSLDAFYKKTQGIVQSRYGSKASSKEIRNVLKNQPQYWTNPVTQKIYRVSYKTGLNKRYTLKPINRQYLEKQQSTAVQKQIAGQYQKGLQKKNVDLKQAHDDRYDILEKELSSVQATIADYNQRGIRGPNYDAAIAKQNEVNTQINNLEEGRWYTEHNVYLQSEKARNYVLDNSGVRINDSKEFQLGNIANQTPRLENLKNPDTLVFRNLKNNLERVLDNAPDNYFSYPNYIVNSNPRLSGGREGIIRIEYSPIEWQPVPETNNMRPVLTGFKVKGGILSGKNVIEIDTKDIDFIRNNLSTPEDIKNWLSREHGINPVSQDQSFPKEGFEIRLSKSPLVSRAEQIKQFQRLAKEVQAGRKTWAEVFSEAGYEIVPQTGKGKTKLTAAQKATKLRKQSAKQKKLEQSKISKKTEGQKKQGQIDVTERLTGPLDYQKILDEEIPD